MGETHYVPLPTHDLDRGEAESSTQPSCSAASSAWSSPRLQSALVLGDRPYEQSEKSDWSRLVRPFPAVEAASDDESKVGARRARWMQRWRTAALVAVCLILAMAVWVRHPGSTTSLTSSTSSTSPPYRLEDDVVLIVKTGSSTVHERLPIHLLSSTRHANTLYVSDYALTLSSGGVDIALFDALSNVSPAISALPEFAALRAELRALVESNQDARATASRDAGWKLDKYKFLPAFAEAYRRFPAKKWYVMVEADTFVFYKALLSWLSTLDPETQYMFGHATFTDYDGVSTMFTHGGSGIVLSKAIMELTFGKDERFEWKHDELIQKSAFGDALLSKAVYDTPGVTLSELSDAGERFNSDPPRVVKFHTANWCAPVLSFHHVTGADVAHLYDFESRIEAKLDAGDTVRWSDVWDEFIPLPLRRGMLQVGSKSTPSKLEGEQPGEVSVPGWQTIEEWDSETTDLPTSSAQECLARCRADARCMMWQWRRAEGEREQEWSRKERRGKVWGKCRFTGEFLRIGLVQPKAKDGVTAGWMSTRIDRWRKERSCSGRTGLNAYD